MPRKKKTEETEKTINAPLSDKDSPDYFAALVQNCIGAYEKLNNDSLALDYCKVSDKRLRVMILDDEEYKRETKSIYARQRLEEVQELEYLANLAANEDADEDDEGEYIHPSERGKKRTKKSITIDKDRLNMRFKAAQIKREIMKEMAEAAGDTESHAVNFLFVPITREEFEKLATAEINYGTDNADFDELVGKKEEIPAGTSGKLHTGSTARTKIVVENDDDFFDVLPNGEIVER